jgi:hypothetical protein
MSVVGTGTSYTWKDADEPEVWTAILQRFDSAIGAAREELAGVLERVTAEHAKEPKKNGHAPVYPSATIAHAPPFAPPSLQAWATKQCHLLPMADDGHEVLPGVTLGELRGWVG